MTSSYNLGFHYYNPEIHHRRSIRLQNYDYSQPDYYFITICIHDRWIRLFGDVVSGKMVENKLANIVSQCWLDLPNHYRNIVLDAFVIMPNHIHGIICIRGAPILGAGFKPSNVGAGFKPAPTLSTLSLNVFNPAPTGKHGLPEFVRALKTFSSRRINESGNLPDRFKWQRNYWEHIIRDKHELFAIRTYINNNPQNWEQDNLNSQNGTVV